MATITFMPSGETFEVEDGTTILLAAVRNGLQLRHDCTEAICGTDKVKVIAGNEHLSEKDDNEELTLTMLNAAPDNRLACVARILGAVVVEIPE
jgi:ferredoxin